MGGILPDKSVSKKIIATNSGKEMLEWSVVAQKHVLETNHSIWADIYHLPMGKRGEAEFIFRAGAFKRNI